MKKQAILERLREIEAFNGEYYRLKEQLIDRMKVGETVIIGDVEYKKVDKFAEKNKVWKPVPFLRFDLEEVDEV